MTKIAFFSLLIAIVVYEINAATITAEKNQETFEFLLLHNNDMHGRFEETDEYTNDCPAEDKAANKCYGGFARVANVIRKHRQNAASGNGPPVLYLNAGDTYTGTPWFSLNKENITTEFLNALAPEAMCLGNHEFDFGLEHLAPHLKELKFPILAANLNYSAVPELSSIDLLKKSTVLNVNGTKVGIIGYITPETNELSLVEYVEFTDEIKAINQEAALLRAQDVKIIIALGHSGIEKDLEIAEKCPLVDIVVGAHSHTYLGKKQDIEVPYGPYPMVVTPKNSNRKVPVVQAYAFTKYMGSLLLKFDLQGNLLSWNGAPLLLDAKIPKEADIEKMLEKYRPAILEYGSHVIGYTAVLFDGHTCRYRECNIGNFITDAMVFQHAINYTSIEGEWTDAAIGMMQAGGIRGTIDEETNITKLNLNTVMPFEDRVTILDLMGSDIMEVLEHSVHRYDPIVRNGEFMQVSGLKIRYNVSKPTGMRVNYVEVRCASCRVPEYFPIQLNQTYRVLMNEYPYHGGDGYSMLKNKPGNITKLIDIDNVIQYLARKTPIYLQRESRIVFEGSEDQTEDNKCNANAAGSLIGVVKSTTLIVTIANLIIHFVQ